MNARTAAVFAVLLLAATQAAAQAVQWSSVAYGSGNPESYPAAMKLDAGGNVFMTGFMEGTRGGMRTVKYAAGTGQVLWQVIMSNAGSGGMAVDAAGDVLIAGSVAAPGSQAGALFKFHGGTGALLWQASLPNSGFTAVALDAAGNAVATGSVSPGQMRTAKFSGATGGVLWDTILPAYASGNFVALDALGDVIVAGAHVGASNVNYATVKLRGNDGGVTWQRTFNGAANFDDFVAGIAVDANGNAVVTGRSVNASGRLSAATLKYAAADGATMWQNILDGGTTDFFFGRALAVDGAGNAYVVGVGSLNGDSAFHFMTMKLDGATGVQQWRRIEAATSSDATGVAVDAAGNAFATGVLSSLAGIDFKTMRFAPDGTVAWQVTYRANPGTPNENVAVALDPQGHVVVAGRSLAGAANDFLPVKHDGSSGALLWRGGTRLLTQPASMRLATSGRSTLVRDPAGNAIVAGTASNGTNNDIKVVKYLAATGAVAWERTIDFVNQDDRGLALAVDSVGNVIVAGSASGPSSSSTLVARLRSTDGSTIWQDGFTNGSQGNRTLAVALDPAGNVFVAGAMTFGGQTDMQVTKRDGSTGAALWTQSVIGTANQNDEAVALVIDAAGNAIATGIAYNSVNASARTVKYSNDGALLWEATYNDAVSGDDKPTGLALDASGNVFVTGYWRNGASIDFFTIKYAGGNGAVMWNRSLDAGNSDQPFAVAVDGAGNAIVTGGSHNGTNFDMRTIKYAAFDGRVQWDRTFAGVASGHDLAYALGLTASGDAVVAGSTWNGTTNDFKVVKYASADGALLWDATLNGSWNGEDVGLAVAIVPGAVYVAGNCQESDVQGICTVRIEDSGVAAGGNGASDFNADRVNDLVLQQPNGTVSLWLMRGGVREGGRDLLTAGSGWTPKLVADFDGDGYADIVWEHTDGRVAMWLMVGDQQVGGALLMKAGAGWSPVFAADFDGRGHADILWQHRDGRTAIWLMDGAVQAGGASLLGAQSGWEPKFVADFDGDNMADILWVHRDGRVAIWLMSGARQVGGALLMPAKPGWVPRLVGDFNGDRRADILWQHTDGRTALWMMNGAVQAPGGAVVMQAGSGWHATRLADVNGDGRDDIVWRHEDGRIAVWLMDGAVQLGGGILAQAGSGLAVKRAADFNGDGRKDLVVQGADGTLTTWLMNGAAFTAINLQKGATGWAVVP